MKTKEKKDRTGEEGRGGKRNIIITRHYI